MKIIVPMAGRGSRLRPHTLTVPKPMIPVAGKPIVQRLVEDIAEVCEEKIDEVAFVIGDFGDQVEKDLLAVAESLGAKGSIYYQDEPLGTAHAILCAKESMEGKVIVAFADTLFRADFKLNEQNEGIIWVSKVDDPSAFGVVKLKENNEVDGFVEKPEEFISDLAIIGIYYFKDGAYLRDELQYLIDNDIRIKGGEFGLTDALDNMKKKGTSFAITEVKEWLDCGNKESTVFTNQKVLMHKAEREQLVDKSAKIVNSVIIPPCFIGRDAKITNSVVGPYVSLGVGSVIESSVVRNSLIQNDTSINDANIANSMIGSKVDYRAKPQDLSLGDFTKII